MSGLATPLVSAEARTLSGKGDVDLGLWFHLDPEPLFALNAQGQVKALNTAAKQLVAQGRIVVRPTGLLQFGIFDSDESLERALRTVRSARDQRQRLILRGQDGSWSGADLYAMCEPGLFILAIRLVDVAHSRLALDAISSAFQLTRSETAIVDHLCRGDCPKAAARGLNMSENTVRAHLRSIYAKMGVKGLTNTVAMATHLMA